jgi:hypothetical protein
MGMAYSTMGRRGVRVGHWWESQKESDHYEDQDVGGWAILGLLGWGISPSQGRNLTQTQNKHKQTCVP